ncbi:MAG: helix-turn-helix domain-containing protein [Victivallales bacterium]|nr:helix-turn-helix domain-containing protein [Victivallales bacterium]
MQENVAQSIIMLAQTDPYTGAEQLNALKAVCAGKLPASKPKAPPVLVDHKTACLILGRNIKPVTQPTVQRLLREGKIHLAPRSGKKKYYYRAELEDFVFGKSAS